MPFADERTTPSDQTLWGISAYFNPMHYERRQQNYQVFRRHLSVPLLTCELSFDGSFELGRDDADIVVQLTGRDILWQKERLLNLAVSRLPPHVQFVAWLDCDVIFGRTDWPIAAAALLENVPLAQLYSELVRLPQTDVPVWPQVTDHLEARPSLLSLVTPADDLSAVCRKFPRLPGRTFPGPIGFAWAARRELLETHGLYDVGVLGGGDISLISALAGCYDVDIAYHGMSPAAERHYRSWADRLASDVDGNVGCLPGSLFHLWHGDLANRRYATRYQTFQQFDFDPVRDLAHDENGIWRWNSDKSEMHRFVAEYFHSRREDG